MFMFDETIDLGLLIGNTVNRPCPYQLIIMIIPMKHWRMSWDYGMIIRFAHQLADWRISIRILS